MCAPADGEVGPADDNVADYVRRPDNDESGGESRLSCLTRRTHMGPRLCSWVGDAGTFTTRRCIPHVRMPVYATLALLPAARAGGCPYKSHQPRPLRWKPRNGGNADPLGILTACVLHPYRILGRPTTTPEPERAPCRTTPWRPRNAVLARSRTPPSRPTLTLPPARLLQVTQHTRVP